ncbi:MAG: methyltransferase, partial [Pseudomonadota bacterium]
MTEWLLGEVREDRFLDGSVRLLQPLSGYRAATDPVLLAAAIPAWAGEAVLDLGCGAGAASLCLASRVEVSLSGVEIQPGYLELAAANAQANGVEIDLHEGDVAAMPAGLKALSFDQVMLNPPYHPEDFLASPIAAKDRAHREAAPLA